MRKNDLAKIPIKPLDVKNKQGKYSVIAHKVKVKDTDVLVVEVYYSRNEAVSYRFFIQEHDYLTFDSRRVDWVKTAIENILGYSFFEYTTDEKGQRVIESIQTQKIVEKFTKCKKGNALMKLQKFQAEIREERLKRKYKKITDPIDEVMAQVPEEPHDFKEWINKDALYSSRYMFYKYTNKKSTEAWCSWCNEWSSIGKPKHNENGICPNCKSQITYKSYNKQKYMDDYRGVSLLQKIGDGFVLRNYRVSRSYRRRDDLDNIWKVETSVTEHQRVLFNREGYKESAYDWELFKQREMRWCIEDYNRNPTTILYHYNLQELLKGTRYEKSKLGELASSKKEFNFSVKSFIEEYPAIGFLEYLINSKLYNMAAEIIGMSHYQGYYDTCCKNKSLLDGQAKNIKDLLRIEKYDLPLLQECDANLKGLAFLRYCRDNKIKPVAEQIEFVQQNYFYIEEFTRMIKYTSVGKTIKYIEKQSKKIKEGIKETTRLWEDCLNLEEKLKYDMTNSFVVFPMNVKERHDECVEITNIMNCKDKIARENQKYKKIEELYEEYRNKFSFENEEYIITVPKDAGEIIIEGQRMHHCVGGYTEKVSKQQTIILFIRKKEECEKSFYTMEINPKDYRIVQNRGKYNRDYDEITKKKVKAFEKKFEEEVLKKLKSKRNRIEVAV